MKKMNTEGEFTDKEIASRMNKALARALVTPHKPHKPLKAAKKTGKPKGK